MDAVFAIRFRWETLTDAYSNYGVTVSVNVVEADSAVPPLTVVALQVAVMTTTPDVFPAVAVT